MIKRRTTLVLGAGASEKYNFPLGSQLTREVIAFLGNSDSHEVKTLQELGYSPQTMTQFSQALCLSGKSSVDAFLEHRDDFLDIGKAAIACCLIPRENISHLFNREGSWYQHLSGALNCKPADFANNAVSVVTFNYDRSLECYLHTALVNTYRLTETQAAELLANIPIVHVHGSLGRLPWQRGDAKVRPYSTEISPDSIAAARDSIQVIHEGRYDSPSFTEASGLINSADVVVFLGFGYHPTNVARLGIKLDRDCVFYGSAYQLTKSECKTVQRHFNDRLHMGHSSWDVLEFLRQDLELTAEPGLP
jgi:hypothetical protein